MAVVDELVTLLSLEDAPGNQRVARGFQSGLESIKRAAVAAGVALTGVAVAAGAWGKSLAQTIDEGGKFARSVGVAYEALQEFEFAVERSGGTAQEFRSDLEKLTSSMASPIPGEFNKELALLGISTRDASGNMRDATEVLTDLAAKFEGFTDIQAQQFGQRLGLSQSTIRLLQQSRASIADLRREARALGGIIPEGAQEDAAAFNDALTNMNFALMGIARTAGISVLPAITEIIQAMQAFFLANREVIRSGLETFIKGTLQGFRQFSEIVGTVAGKIADFLGPIGDLTDRLDGVDAIALGATSALLGIAAIAGIFVAKFALIGAAVGAVVLAVEDLITYLQGGDSVIGRVIDSIQRKIDQFSQAVQTQFNDMVAVVDEWVASINAGIDSITGFFNEGIGGFFSDLFDGIDPAVIDRTVQATNQPMMAAATNISNYNQGGDRTVNNTFHISGAGNPGGVANEIARRLGQGEAQQMVQPGIRAQTMR